MNPRQEAEIANTVAFAVVGAVPPIASGVWDMPYPWWVIPINLVIAWLVGEKVYRHVIDDHLRIAERQSGAEKK